MDKKNLLEDIMTLCWQASDKILNFYKKDFNTETKADGSPLSDADLASHQVLFRGLEKLTPNIPIVSEESEEMLQASELGDTFWLVDPLDGTKEFIKHRDEFTVNVALVQDGLPVLGVVQAPALNILYAGIVGEEAFIEKGDKSRAPISVRPYSDEGLTIVGSRSHGSKEEMDKFLQGKKLHEFIATGSSLKFCKVAEGKADAYPRFGRTMEWDTAAGHAVLLAAGGTVLSFKTNQQLTYGKEGLDNPHFLAISKDTLTLFS